MNPIAVEPEHAAPAFSRDPAAWLRWVDNRIRAEDLGAVTSQPPSRYQPQGGEGWRCVQTDDGVEIRPTLGNGSVRLSPNPLIGAIQVGERVVVELISTEGSWVGAFGPDELDLTALGEAMLRRRHLPHDNLRLLFGRSD